MSHPTPCGAMSRPSTASSRSTAGPRRSPRPASSACSQRHDPRPPAQPPRSYWRRLLVSRPRYAERMTVRDMLTALQTLPREAELLAFEAGCENYCEREVDEVEWQGGRVYLRFGAHRDDPPGG